MKKGQSKPLIAVMIFLLLIIAIFLFYTGSQLGSPKSSVTGQTVSNPSQQEKTQEKQTNCREVQVPYDYLEEYQETVPYSTQKCETKEIPYNIDNFVINYNVCNEKKKDCKTGFMGIPYDCVEYCIDKSISCSLTLRNLDNEEQGSWTIRFLFYQIGTSKEIQYKDVSIFLYPQTSKVFTGTARIQSSGVDGDANKELTCNYHRINLPTKQVCRDVTDYKEVTKTRTVTRYRTEMKCE